MHDQDVRELEIDEQAIVADLPTEIDDELVIAVSAPTSNKEWQE